MQKLLTYEFIYLIPILLSAIFSLRSFGLKWPKQYRLFSAFLILTLVSESFAIAWKWHLHETSFWRYTKNNHWIYNSFHIGRFVLFVLFYYLALKPSQTKEIIKFISAFVTVFAILNYFFIQGPYQSNSYTILLTNACGILLSLLFFKEVIGQTENVKLRTDPMFWISLGTFIYCSVSIPYFIFSAYVFKNQTAGHPLLNVNSVLNIIMYTCYLIAFLCPPRSPK